MRLGTEVVDLVGHHLVNDLVDVVRVAQVPIVQLELGVGVVGVLIDMIDAFGVEGRRPADEPVDLVPLLEQELREV